MKSFLLFLLIAMTSGVFGQANTCVTANPFCSSNSYNFPNATSGTAPTGPNYGCLGGVPRPIWYYMEIGTSGTIDMLLQQTTGANGTGTQIDVDFAMWGPFSSLSAGCSAVMGGTAPIQSSYSTSYSEDIGIGVSGGSNSICGGSGGPGQSTPPAAVAGQVYIVLLTNYNGAAGYISFNQTGGTGSADCSIVNPCTIDNFTATVSACNPATNTYSVSGNIAFSNPPDIGQLIVESCNGTQTVVASAPFSSGSYPYTVAGLAANGAGCDVEVYFSDGACSQILTYTAPTCPVACSFSSINGNVGACQGGSVFDLTGTLAFTNPPSTGQLVVQDCNGNSATYNAPFTSPLNFSITGINANGQACSVTAQFTADPACTISLNYTNTPPCNCNVDIGTFSTTTAGESNSTYVLCYGDEILVEANGDYTPPGQAVNPPLAEGYEPGIAWLVYSCPPTVALTPNATDDIGDDPCFIGISSSPDFYDINDLYWVNTYGGSLTDNTVYFVPITMYNMTEGYYSYVNGGLPCYETGTPYAIQYLPEITQTTTPNCQTGSVSVTVQGGSPAINGTNFTASGLSPATASFVSNTVANGGTFVINGLQNGDNYSFNIADEFGCPITITGTFQGVSQSGFTYPQSSYCKSEANPSPTLTTGVTGGTYSGSAGLVINATTGVVDIVATPAGTYTVIYTSPGAPCNSSSTFSITINALPVVSAPAVSICNGQTATLTASGADSYVWSPATGLNTTTGVSVQSTVTANQTYTITGTNTTTGCVGTGSVTVTVNPNPTPTIMGQTEYCAGTSATIQTNQTYSSYSWSNGQSTPTIQVTDADNPIQVTVTNAFGCSATSPVYTVAENNVITVNTTEEICQGGSIVIHGVSRTTAGIYSLTQPSTEGCDSTSNVTLIVNPLPVINAGTDQTVCEGESVTLNATGAPGIVWNPVQTNGTPFVQPVGVQVYTATGTDANGCVNTDQVQITVLANPVLTAVQNRIICNGAASGAVNFVSSVTGTNFAWINDTPSIGLGASGNGNINSFTAVNNTSTPVVATITVTPTVSGCEGDPITFTITVQPSPTATVSGTASVCIGGTSPVVTFTGGTGTAPYVISYNVNGGATQTVTTTGNTATINAPTATAGVFVYNLVGVEESTYGCDGSAMGSATITINALPVINAGNDVSVCPGSQVTLTASGAGTLPANYSWVPVVTNGVPFVPATTGTYTVTGTDANGCSNTDNVLVTVNVAQNVDAGPNQEICIGNQVILNGSPNVPGTTFTWTGGVTNGVPFSPTTSATYIVTSTDANGCTSSDQVDVIVHNLPIIEAGTNISGCEGDLFTLTGSGAGPGGQYVWSQGVQNGVPFTPPTGIVTYVVVGTDSHNCSNTDSIESKIEAIPNVSFYVTQDQNCVPATVTFHNTTSGSVVNCIWNLDNGTTIVGCDSVTNVFNYAGVYGASLQVQTQMNGCVGYLYQDSVVLVDGEPVASFTPNPSVGTQINNQIVFQNNSYGASTYEWDFGDGIGTSTEENPYYTYDEDPGLYTVMLVAISPAGCVDTAYSNVTIQEELIFYVPNTFTPDQDQYNETFKPIFTFGYDPFDYSLFIFDRWGEMIFESHDASIGWSGTYGVSGKTCQDGSYTWKIEVKTTRSDERKMFVGHVNLIR